MNKRSKHKHEYETPSILGDAPLRDEDAAYFHFDDFAATLARLIADRNTSTPLTICVSGPWGSGKTTLLRRIQRQLDRTLILLKRSEPALGIEFVNPDEYPEQKFRVCRTVWFNAWKYADEDELLVALIRKIVQTMAEDGSVMHAIKAKLNDPTYPRRDVLNTVLNWFSIKTPIGDIKLGTGEPEPTPFSQNTALLDLFDDSFTHLLAAWLHQKPKADQINPQKGILVVFIDDLDRCLPEKTVQVLEAIKLFLDKSGCVFVIGSDVELVRQAVENHYQNTKVTGLAAADYLDKIIQLRFALPPLVADHLQEYLKDLNVGDEMLVQWKTLIAAAEINPRRVKAVVNDIELQWKMLVNSQQAQGVRQEDFIRWSALLRAAPPNFRDRVYNIEDLDLRLKFVQDALQWSSGQGDETLLRTFQEFEKDSRRLRRVLHQIGSFSSHFDAKTLNAFIHLTAPPVVTQVSLQEQLDHLDTSEIQTFKKDKEINQVLAGEPTSGKPAFRRLVGELEFRLVPAGKFIMGSKEDDPLALESEKPQHTIDLPDYWIARFPVTNEQFSSFVREAGYRTKAEEKGSSFVFDGKEWKDTSGANWQHPEGAQSDLAGRENHPVVHISWLDGCAYCEWFADFYQRDIGNLVLRLPSEAEWEKAARGTYGQGWPWGSEWDSTRCNNAENGIRTTTPVDNYLPQGASPHGCLDMAGNVWEWTRSLWGKGYALDYVYPYTDRLAERENLAAPNNIGRVLRGGSFVDGSQRTRCTFRDWAYPDLTFGYYGFRVCLSYSH